MVVGVRSVRIEVTHQEFDRVSFDLCHMWLNNYKNPFDRFEYQSFYYLEYYPIESKWLSWTIRSYNYEISDVV